MLAESHVVKKRQPSTLEMQDISPFQLQLDSPCQTALQDTTRARSSVG